ncbi:MAG: methionine adenosyltransferase [Planctomycetes bacterium]|jgi:S-adenosylmethionine synthetase|nr:methionine adenosyltransferase [Planctomycetota bacterium]
MSIKLITSESVAEGHPDKVCDQLSDGILDEMLKQDQESHAAIECFCTNGLVLVGGEARTEAYVNIDETVRTILKGIGYDTPESGFFNESVGIISALHEQSQEIAQGVDEGSGEFKEQGAGDQGLMYGFATTETEELMPQPIILAHALVKKMAELRKNKTLPYLFPDGKSQVTLQYENGLVTRAETIVIAAHHSKDIEIEALRHDILNKVIKPVLGSLLDDKTKLFINATGSFLMGGPRADTGLTGRKIMVDTYGGLGLHGGGAFSGKDATKVDRSAAYMARYVAKNIVASGLADKCQLQVAYAIGVSEPVGIYLDTFQTNKVAEEKIVSSIKDIFNFHPKEIISTLELKRPIFKKTAAYGHFGRNESEFSWEKTDKVSELKRYFGI